MSYWKDRVAKYIITWIKSDHPDLKFVVQCIFIIGGITLAIMLLIHLIMGVDLFLFPLTITGSVILGVLILEWLFDYYDWKEQQTTSIGGN